MANGRSIYEHRPAHLDGQKLEELLREISNELKDAGIGVSGCGKWPDRECLPEFYIWLANDRIKVDMDATRAEVVETIRLRVNALACRLAEASGRLALMVAECSPDRQCSPNGEHSPGSEHCAG